MPTMMGQQTRTESLFYYFRLEDQIPQDHLLRVIDERVDLSFVRERVKSLYSATGRPSIDPEMLLRLLLVGYHRPELEAASKILCATATHTTNTDRRKV